MTAWMRLGWGVVALGWVLGSRSQALPISRAPDLWNRAGWSPVRDPSLSSQTTPWSRGPLPTAPVPPPTPQWHASAPSGGSPPGSPVLNPPAAAQVAIAPSVPVTPISIPSVSILPATPSAPVAPVLPATPTVAVAPIAAQVIPAAMASSAPVANAFVDMGVGPYKDGSTITSGHADAWYNSQNPQVLSLFGGTPTAQQQADFSAAVMQRVQQTFQLSHVPVTLTSDPNAPAAHALSLVSNTSAQILPSAIGMTFVGGNGFSFIDQQASAAHSVDQLEWITAHNIAHELMLAFGVGENYDRSGTYIDARNALWTMMTDPSSTFSADAAKALNRALAQGSSTSNSDPSAQVFGPQPVPEPAALVLWALGSMALALRLRTRNAA